MSTDGHGFIGRKKAQGAQNKDRDANSLGVRRHDCAFFDATCRVEESGDTSPHSKMIASGGGGIAFALLAPGCGNAGDAQKNAAAPMFIRTAAFEPLRRYTV
jgi:hypothetical protein